MSLDLQKMEYLLAVWFVGGTSSDWMAAAFREKGDPTWRLTYRFRYYRGKRVAFDSDDEKHWYSGTFDPGLSEQQVLERVDVVAQQVSARNGRPVDRVDVAGEPLSLMEKARGRSWLHMKWVPVS